MKETKSQARKRQILTKKIQTLLLKYKALFLTLTFNDKTLSRTNEKTRERIIKDYLKNNTAIYIANRDYGAKKGREHYHALVITSTLNNDDLKAYKGLAEIKRQINIYNWLKYGQIKVDIIGGKWRPEGDKDYKKTADNLSRHFRKPSTKESRIIASRGIPTKNQQIERLKALRDAKQNHLKTTSANNDLISEEIADFNDYIENDFNKLINDEKEQEKQDSEIRLMYLKLMKDRFKWF